VGSVRSAHTANRKASDARQVFRMLRAQPLRVCVLALQPRRAKSSG